MVKLSHRIKQPEFIFLVLGLVFGVAFLVVTPPFQVPDEPNHFYRAYQVSEGTLLAEKSNDRVGGVLPVNIQKVTIPYMNLLGGTKITNDSHFTNARRLQLSSPDRTFIDFNNTALYSPVCYLPQALGIFVSRCFNAPVLCLLYAARFFALFAWIILLFFSIRLMPFCKWLFCFLGLLPMSVFINASASADVMTNGLSFLFIATVLNTAYHTNTLQPKRITLLCLLIFLIPLTKTIYITLLPLLLIIPKTPFGSWKRLFVIYSLFVILALSSFGYWSAEVRDKYLSYTNYNKQYRDKVALVENGDADKQLAFINKHHIVALRVVRRSGYRLLKYHIPDYIASFGWTELKPPKPMAYFLYACLLLISLFEYTPNIKLNWKIRLIFLGVFCITLSAVILSQFLTWVGPGPQYVRFIQARYLIPFYPLVFLCLYTGHKIKTRLLPVLVPVIACFGLIYCFLIIAERYY